MTKPRHLALCILAGVVDGDTARGNAVMEAQKDLVEVVHTLKQVVCVKG